MKIKKLISILVCLGVVAFASSTASAFSLIEVKVDTLLVTTAYQHLLDIGDDFAIFSSSYDVSTGYDIYGMLFFSSDGEMYGDFEWGVSGPQDPDLLNAASTDPEGNAVAAVLSRNADHTKSVPVFLKVSPTGVLLEEVWYEDLDCARPFINGVDVDSSGTIVITGHGQRTGGSIYNLFTIVDSIDAPPTYFWYGSNVGNDMAKKTIVDETDIYMASSLSDPAGDLNFTISKINKATGDVVYSIEIDNSPTYDWVVDMNKDGAFILVAAHYIDATTGLMFPYLLKLNADGTIAAERTLTVTNYTSARTAFLSPIADWYVVTEYYDYSAGRYISVLNEVDKNTLDVSSTTESGIWIYKMTAPANTNQDSAFKGKVKAIGVGRNASGFGSIEYILKNDSLVVWESIDHPLYTDVKIVNDSDGTTVGMGANFRGISYAVLRAQVGGGVSKPLTPGHNKLDFSPDFPIITEFENVLTEGTITVDLALDPAPMPAHLELVGDILSITVDAEYTGTNNFLTWLYSDDALDEPGLNIYKYDTGYLDWLAAGSITSHDTEANTITVKVDSFADSALVKVYPLPATENLISLVYNMNFKQGISNSLDAKLQNIRDALTAANAGIREDALNKFQAFINAVLAQSGKEISEAQAKLLINEALAIMAGL